MWNVNGNALQMVAGDYGVELPITVTGVTFAATDEMKLAVKNSRSGETLIEKTFNNIQQNTINLELTEAESALLPVGCYTYILDWYQNGAFLCNVIPAAHFKVVGKA